MEHYTVVATHYFYQMTLYVTIFITMAKKQQVSIANGLDHVKLHTKETQ